MSVELSEVALTQYAHGAGCGCKIAPQVLKEILQGANTQAPDKKLLVGNSSNDDAAVYDMGGGMALVATTDFFMPIVDDAFDFGCIASANAISDVYAMGGKPILALAILGWPVNKLSPALAQKVMEGARTICAQAGIHLAGGHSIDSPEPMFGLSVNGIVEIANLKKNNTAKEGDLLFLTKPIGTGILSTAQKRNLLKPEDKELLVKQLSQLNSVGEELGKIKGVNAMTDVTGFGLLGHLLEMAKGSGLSASISYEAIPKISSLSHYLAQQIVPDATYRNWNAYSSEVDFSDGVDVMQAFQVLPDPQTNGGLLISVSPKSADEVIEVLNKAGLTNFIQPIGQLILKKEKPIRVEK
jgi:selenide, water dikinase